MEFNTVILRFRDLVTENGKTIEEHKSIIQKNGYVWWAWWRKGREKTPFAELMQLTSNAQDNPLKVFLVDSGQEKLYLATCKKIECNSNHTIESPEKDKTPEYYNENSYYAWFKFTEIVECEKDKVKKYSYVDVKSLFEEGEDDYSLFKDKVVFDTKELIQQNRTIWFVRDFVDGDKENEIRLLNSNYVQPSNFSIKYNELVGSTLLWLSDLHLSNGVLSVASGEKSLTNHIKKACESYKQELFSDISALIVSGDITNCYSQDGFNQAKSFVANLNREIGFDLDNQRIIVCPGNHDLKRIDETPPMKNGKEYMEPDYFWDHPESSEYFENFYKEIFCIKPNKYLANGRKLLTKSGKTIEVVALNSMILQQYKGFEGHGYISQEQLDFVEEEMKWSNKTSAYRIIVLHHHYCPACLKDQIAYDKAGSVVYDADRLIRWAVKNNVKLILHGHKHNEFFSKIYMPKNDEINVNDLHDIYVVSLGGTGAEDSEHKFATITFGKKELSLSIFRFYPDQIAQDKLDKTITIPYGE